MQNNVTELTQRLLNSLDGHYNVVDMPSVIEIITLLETVVITKDILETTRLGRYINNLRKNTKNESLAKSAKGLLKKWRDSVLPEPNGQLKQAGAVVGGPVGKEDVNLNETTNKKRPLKDQQSLHNKRTKLNGTNEFDFSDNSNSSFKEVINANNSSSNSDMNMKKDNNNAVVLINSDSNSSLPDIKTEPILEQQQPKKRGRKKGSGNHKNLLDEAETSFTNKMAVSRGNAKVKTTQELIASLQNKKNAPLIAGGGAATHKRDDLTERAALLTERVSIIDQKLNTNASRYKSAQKKLIKNSLEGRNDKVIESGIVVNVGSDRYNSATNSIKSDDDIVVDDDDDVVVDDNETKASESTTDEQVAAKAGDAIDADAPRSLSVEEALKRLPPIDRDAFGEDDGEESCDGVRCTCTLQECNKANAIGDGEDVRPEPSFSTYEFVEDGNCAAKEYLVEKYRLNDVTDERVKQLHETFIPGVNGNVSLGRDDCASSSSVDRRRRDGLYVNVVPNVNTERIPKKLYNNNDDSPDFTSENYKKYSISDCDDKTAATTTTTTDCGDNNNIDNSNSSNLNNNSESSQGKTFREWHEVVETTSYNGETLRILPYVIID